MLTVQLLGPIEVRIGDRPVELGGPQQRALIAHLALEPGRLVSVERLIDLLWGDEPPRVPLGTLQSYVSRLRRALEPDRAAGAQSEVLVTDAPGYVLRIEPEQVDLHRFRRLIGDARSAAHDPRAVLARLDEALALWRGPALAGIGPAEQTGPISIRLEEEREAAVDDRFEALLALGRHVEAVPLLQRGIDELPLRERRWALLALALYRSSRQADALRAMSRARSVLAEELGLEPGPELRALERRIFDHDPTLLLARQEQPAAGRDPVAVAEPAIAVGAELVGRTDEWRQLLDALDAASAGAAQFVLIEGEPGIGKSTVIEALLAHAGAAGWSSAVGRCVEPGLAPSLWPCLEVVREMLAVAAAAAAQDDHHETGGSGGANPLRALASPGTATVGATSAVELAEHFLALIDELGSRRWLIVLDDLQWADQATLDVVRLALERLGHRRVVVVAAHRPPELVPGSLLRDALGALHRSTVATRRLQLSPLDLAGVARLVELTSGVTPSEEVIDQIRRRAAGNPLFVSELARLAGSRGLNDSSEVPQAIRDVVRGRLASLPERARAELEVAAVLGERFELRTSVAASDRDAGDCLDALDAAIVTRILVPADGGYRFAHALVRDAVLAEISDLRRTRLHHRAAEAILAVHGDGPDHAEPVAYHRLASASFADPLTVAKAAIRASDVARWRTALDTAERLAESALDVIAGASRSPTVDAVEVEALEALVCVAVRRRDMNAELAVAERASAIAERTGSDAAAALALFLRWGDVDQTDDLSRLAPAVQPALALFERTADPYARLTTAFIVASFDFLCGRIDDAAARADEALLASGAPNPSDRPDHVPVVVLPVIVGIIRALLGDVDRARREVHLRARSWLSQRREVDPTAADALAFASGLVEALLANPDEVLGHLRFAGRNDEAGFVSAQAANCDVLTAWAMTKLGDPSGLERAHQAMAEIEAGPDRVLRSCVRSLLGEACLEAGDQRALEVLAEARSEGERRGEVWWLAETIRLQALADLHLGDGSRAIALLDEAAELAERQGVRLISARIEATRTALDVERPASALRRPGG